MYLTCRIVLKTDENSSRILSIMANFYRNEVNRLINLYAKVTRLSEPHIRNSVPLFHFGANPWLLKMLNAFGL